MMARIGVLRLEVWMLPPGHQVQYRIAEVEVRVLMRLAFCSFGCSVQSDQWPELLRVIYQVLHFAHGRY